MKKTVSYYRSSTKLQEESVTTQQYKVHQYALKNQLFIDDEYPDDSESARKKTLTQRPEMKRLIGDIHQGKVGTLLVYKRDRLARKVEDHLKLYELFKKHEIQVIFIGDNEPPMRFDVFGEMMELFIGVMNQREGEQINERIIDTRMDNFIRGKSIGNLPYGYHTNDEKTKIIREDAELEQVKKIFQEWNSDKYKNMEDLAKALKAKGIKRGSKPWTRNNIKDTLTNPMYMGLRVAHFSSERVSRAVKDLAIITPDEFDLAQQLIEKRNKDRKEIPSFYYLLTDLLMCERCENKLIKNQRMEKGEIYATYECKEHTIKLKQQDIENHVYEKTVHFFTQLFDTNFDQLYQSYAKRQLKVIQQLQRGLQKELEQVEEKLMRATNLWIQRETTVRKDTLISCSAKINTYKEKLLDLEEKKQQVHEIPTNVDELQKTFLIKFNWELLSFEKKKKLLEDMIHFIYADEFTIRIVFKHPFIESNEVVV
jgi:site-specific DNA recombinase